MFFIKLDSPSQEYDSAGSENGTGTSDRRLEQSISELNVSVLRPEEPKISQRSPNSYFHAAVDEIKVLPLTEDCCLKCDRKA